ncbi:MAG: L,D-transpeptidase family protein [archaeon]
MLKKACTSLLVAPIFFLASHPQSSELKETVNLQKPHHIEALAREEALPNTDLEQRVYEFEDDEFGCKALGCEYESYVVSDFDDFLHYYRENKSPKITEVINPQSKKFINEVQKALHFHGYLGKDPDGVLDEETLDAVKTYKRLNALKGSNIDKGFVGHISTSSEVRAKHLENALRTFGKFDGNNDIYVNIPGFKLRYYYKGDLEFKMDIVVGTGNLRPRKEGRKKEERWVTEIQEGTLKYAVVNPYWDVPPGDLTDETREDLKRSASLRKTMEQLTDGKWVPVDSEVSGKKFRQLPGPWNSLGRVGYDFNGGYGQFFHGTPQKSLFKNNVRNFSHGCMRLQDEIEFFRKLQAIGMIDKTLDVNDLIGLTEEGRYKTQYIKLLEPIDVHVVYLQAWINQEENGLVMMMPPDIYRYNQKEKPF